MLPSTAVGTIEMRSVLEPIRRYLKRRMPRAHYFEAKASNIDHENKKLTCKWETSETHPFSGAVTEFDVSYDYLVMAVGAHVNTFNTPGVLEHCHFMKEIKHSREIRKVYYDFRQS
jgi:NADH:ubiquinone reductase (non-electrogenic)